jgi:hypothetical protein
VRHAGGDRKPENWPGGVPGPCRIDTPVAEMLIFLSWSGTRSKAIAAALRDWLPDVLHFAKPWMSDTDIHAGQRWAGVMGTVLQETKFGILCITSENRDAPWLVFEAGALSNTLSEAAVTPLLFDVAFTDISNGPLGQFQAKKLDRQGCHDLVLSINALFGNPIDSSRLSRLFEWAWPDLEARLDSIPPITPDRSRETHRPIDEILEEFALSLQRIEHRLDASETDRSAAESTWEVQETPPAPQIPLDTLRWAVEQAVQNSSLRTVARDVGMSPMGLRNFITGMTPYHVTLRKLSAWYLRSLPRDESGGTA